MPLKIIGWKSKILIVGADIFGDYLVGLYFLYPNLNIEIYVQRLDRVHPILTEIIENDLVL